MARTPVRKRRSLTVENLEHRQMMAGDVAVSVVNGDLIIQGDTTNNQIDVSQLANGSIRVTGLSGWGSQTTVNGNNFRDFSGVTDDVRINMGAGADWLFVNDLTLNGTRHADLRINMGNGGIGWRGADDVVLVDNTSVRRVLDIRTGDGSDQVRVEDTSAVRDINVDSGSDGDTVRLMRVDSRSMNVSTGAGVDSVRVRNADIRSDLNVDTGSSGDNVELRNLSVGRDLNVDTRGGQDRFTATNVDVADDFILDTGEGEDTSSDMDVVVLNDVQVGDLLWARLGAGHDDLTVGHSSAGRAHFWGDSGVDSLWLVPDNVWGTYNDWSFSWVAEGQYL